MTGRREGAATTAADRESRSVRAARRAYAAALADRLADLLTDADDEGDDYAAEVRDILASLVALVPGPEVPR
jgi:hypothetical protein